MSFPAKTKQEMQDKIDELVDNRQVYITKHKLSTKAAGEFYKKLNYKGD